MTNLVPLISLKYFTSHQTYITSIRNDVSFICIHDITHVPRSRKVDLYIHSPICLHGVVFIKHRDNFTFNILSYRQKEKRTDRLYLSIFICHSLASFGQGTVAISAWYRFYMAPLKNITANRKMEVWRSSTPQYLNSLRRKEVAEIDFEVFIYQLQEMSTRK
jgi:hypothetical protein